MSSVNHWFLPAQLSCLKQSESSSLAVSRILTYSKKRQLKRPSLKELMLSFMDEGRATVSDSANVFPWELLEG